MTTLFVGIYVDDLFITVTNDSDIAEFKEQMHWLFEMSDLGLLSYYLRIEVNQNASTITLCQSAYAGKILDMAGMKGCNAYHTLMDNWLKLSKASTSDAVDATWYGSIIGGL